MRNDWNRLNALPLTSRSSNITALDKLFVWVAAELATHTHACNTYRIPKWARHLESISISLIPHPATHLVAETRIAPWQTLPLLHLSLPPPFLQIGRRRKNVKKLICHPRGSFVQIRGTSWACEEKEHQFSQSQHSQRKSDKIQEQTISNVKQKFQNLRFIETRVSEGKSASERPHSLFIQTCTWLMHQGMMEMFVM